MSRSPWCAVTGAPAKTALCRPLWTWPAFVTRVRQWPVQPWAWTSWPLGGWRPGPAYRHCPDCLSVADAEPPLFDGPFIIKPRFGGSSIGIDVVQDFATALDRLGVNPHLRFGAVLEPYHPEMSDLQVGVRTWPTLELSAVERPIRVNRHAADILNYRDKYVAGEGMAGANRELPALIPSELEKGLRQAAERIAEVAGVRGVARIDFLSDGDAIRGQRDQHHTWLAGPLPVGGPEPPVRHAAHRSSQRSPGTAHPCLLGGRC